MTTNDPPSIRRIKPTAATQPATTRQVPKDDARPKVVFTLDPVDGA